MRKLLILFLPAISLFLFSCSAFIPSYPTLTPKTLHVLDDNLLPIAITKQTTSIATSKASSVTNTKPVYNTYPSFVVETKKLKIYYPDFVDKESAKEQAEILQQSYDYYCNLIGQEYPYNGKTIEIIFDAGRGNTSSSGNPITMGLDSGIWEGKILPPEPAFFHELVHDFTTRDRASVAKYVDINGAITEAFADLFTYYFRSEKLEINEAVTNYFLNTLKEYEGKNTDPFSLNWGAHQDAQPFICSIFFFISEKYGWDVWNRFFKVARISDLDGIPINKQGSFTDLQRYEDSLVFGDFVYILSIASGENLIPAFENWGFKFEKQIAEKINNMYKDHADYLSELANKYLEKALNKKDSEEYSQALKTLTISKCVCQNLGDIKRLEEIETLIKEIKSKNIIIDGIMDEWPPTAAMISDPSGDVSSNVTSPQGTDLKAIYALMDEKYLYIAIQMYGDFSLSLLRNYFIALDFNGDYQDEYHFGIISNDNVWVFNHTVNRNNWNTESTPGVVAIRGKDTIELRIPRNIYTIPSKILAYCRVTEGGPTVDSTAWFSIVQTKSIFSN